ncbi:MAG: hypothetical protein ACOY94_25560 [Bacillota bacterium]
MSRMAVSLLALLLISAVSGCARPGPAPVQEQPAIRPAEAPARAESPAPADPPSRLLLDLALGDEPGQPGWLPSRVGGVSPRGPLALAVAGPTTIYLLDQAKGRVLHYEGDRLTDSLLTPWVDDQVGDLRLADGALVVSNGMRAFTLDLAGRIRDIRALPRQSDSFQDSKEPVLLGADSEGNRYERVIGSTGPFIRRVSSDGRTLARALEPGGVVDWSISPGGGLYALTWEWGQNRVERARIHEVLPPVSSPTAAGPAAPPEEPAVFGRPVPEQVLLRFPDWAPVTVRSEVDRWNLWRLLATVEPANHPPLPGSHRPVEMQAAFPDGSRLTLHLRAGELSVEGARYNLRTAGDLHGLLNALRASGEGLAGAVAAAGSVRLLVADLPGVERSLTAGERQRLAEQLKAAVAVHPASAPQPLEPSFPVYAIHLEGPGWKGEVTLRGDHHLVAAHGGAAACRGGLAALVQEWLPVPELRPDQVSYLFLADRLEIGPGNDLTRWKNTVVRHLLNAGAGDPGEAPFRDPFILTFHVKGERLRVQVDTEGFTYGGKRYPGTGLTRIVGLQGVP